MDIQWLLNTPQQMKGAKQASTPNLALRAGDLLTASVLEVDKGHDALIAFGQFKAYARLPLPVVTGQDIQIRVEQAAKGLRMAMLPKEGTPKASPSTGQALPIQLFEQVSDRPFLSAHSRLLVPGESIEGRITGFEKDGLMLVDFGKFKAFAKIDIPVRQGQTLPLTVVKSEQGINFSVAPRTPGTALANVTPSPAASTAPMEATGIGQSALTAAPDRQAQPSMFTTPPGEATVTTAASLTAPTAPEMAHLREQVQQMLGDSGLPEKAAAQTLSPPAQAALINLQQLLRPVSPTGDGTALMAGIRDFVENSGIYFEKRLEAAIRNLQDRPTPMTPIELAGQPAVRELMVKDLKPNLLILKQFLDIQSLDKQGPDRPLLETMKSVVQRTLSHIEQQQIGATEKPVDPDLFQAFSHLLLLTENRRDARLKVYYAKKGRDDAGKKPRVALLLEMDRMGTVRTDLWMVGKDLNVTFFVQTAETKAHIDKAQQHIKAALNDSFNTVAVSVLVNEKKIAQFDGEDLTESPRRQVDLSI